MRASPLSAAWRPAAGLPPHRLKTHRLRPRVGLPIPERPRSPPIVAPSPADPRVIPERARAPPSPADPRAPPIAPDRRSEPCRSPSAPRSSTPPEPARACRSPSAPSVVVGAWYQYKRCAGRAHAQLVPHRVPLPICLAAHSAVALTGRSLTFQRRRRIPESSGQDPPLCSRRTRSRHACTPSDSFGTRWA